MEVNKNKTINKAYWEKNINAFSGFYDKKSEEDIMGNLFLTSLYKKLFFPAEKKFMLKRCMMVSEFINRNVLPGMTVADIGCGSGIFIKYILKKGAKVYALDYAQSAIDLVRNSLSSEELRSVELRQVDITETAIPPVDVAISIGVLTYIQEVDKYFDNILPFTKKFLFNYLDAGNILNVARKAIPILDVRKLTYHCPEDIIRYLEERNFKINGIQKLATGFVVNSESIIK